MHFFVHIPKTAGTSFRVAAERWFSPEKVAYDYGEESPVTTACVHRYMYEGEAEDKAGLRRHWEQQGMQLVAGHKAVGRYLDLVGVTRALTFVREPLARAFSAYLHFRREHGFEGSFREFVENPNHQNVHAALLGSISLRALGFVGLTEQYRKSLQLINYQYGWKLRHKRRNRSGFFQPGPESVSEEDKALFRRLNGKDYALYADAEWYFNLRRDLAENKLPFAHAEIEKAEPGMVAGWAWWECYDNYSDRPVQIEIRINDKKVKTVSADQPRKAWERHGAPNQGCVGFQARIDAAKGDRLTCRVAETGQPLMPAPVELQEKAAA
ncbi:MAG: hypothetical protein RQ826_16785 [Xanthomonadales bacterium]|nr:hypothetical protein [Xanthomonadales bacterium]